MNKLYLCFLLFWCVTSKGQVSFPGIDVQHYNFSIRLNDQNDTIKGDATIQVKFLKDVKTLQLNLVKPNGSGKGMLVSAVKEDGRNLSFSQDTDLLKINIKASANSIHSFTIIYKGVPADGLIISTNKFGHRTFFGDNWPNRAHNWLPCADYPGDKATVDFIVFAPDHYQVVSNGLKVEEASQPNHVKRTHWKETAKLSTKLMVIGVADFAIDHTGDVGNIPVYTYVFPENKDVGFKSYAVAKEILPFYIKKVGPFAYEKLANVQSKTKFGGMENASAIFYFENSVTTKDIESLMAHEIAHQWFGDAASETNFSNVWLSEGFATFMTNVYLENKYGIDTLKKSLAHDRVGVFKFEKRRFTPIVDTSEKTDFLQLLNFNSYQKGGWVLHMLRRKLGDSLFWKGIRRYYAKYNGGNASTENLCQVMENAAGQDLEPFFRQWVYTPGHPQLNITWKYHATKQAVELTITQTQNTLFDFRLEVSIDHQLHTIPIKDKSTTILLPAGTKPSTVVIDPDVNLLASFEVVESN
ncbi:MAG TPA: M1 family metallopeptidase [Mucilaginibacter sp.]|jgi:aminopeptidase N